MALSVSGLVRVTVNLSPLAAAGRSFGVLMVAGDSSVINGLERFRTYTTVEGVADDFGLDAPEYGAAALYFGQTPKPKTLMIGRWFREAAAAQNIGGVLSSSESAASAWTGVTNGSFVIEIDGSSQNLSALDFSGVTNMNGVATVINGALTGATIAWDGAEFVVTSSTTGAGVNASGTITVDVQPGYGVQASATINLTGVPANGGTVTVQGTVLTFVTGTPGPLQVELGATATETAQNLLAVLQASDDANLSLMTYTLVAAVVTVRARLYGTAGNAYTLAESATNLTVSGANLSGGVAAKTLTVNSTVFTFVPSNPTSSQILVGPTLAATASNIKAALAASVVSGVAEASYSVSGAVVTVGFKETGTAGNAFTLATTAAGQLSLSGSVLAGGVDGSSVGYATALGSGTDISAKLKLTAALATSLVDGFDAETPAECASVLANKSAAWYGLMFQASVQPDDDESLAVSGLIEALDIKRIYGVTITDTSVLSAIVTSDLASLMKESAYKQSFNQYSENVYAIASLFGRMFSVNFAANRSVINLMYKQEPSVAAETLTENQAAVLKAKRCNVFVKYVNDTSIIQYGVMSGPAYIDEIHGLDWFADAIQTACYNVLYQSATKIPQTDQGVNQLVNACGGVCDQAVSNGLVAPGTWNADGFGQLQTGQYLKTGYYIFAESVALQSQSDREARKAPPIQIAIKLAGAIDTVDVLVDVNR